ncbi:MAG: vanadium-dependent haloperoxidase [Flavobacteriales bacterium]|nr:vanadium-dependent haloperoxidase [Flavobacteriales bacterium]
MYSKLHFFSLLIISILLLSCNSKPIESSIKAKNIHGWNELLEAAVVNDFFPPPIASRIYSYPNMAAYEVLTQENNSYSSLSNFYKNLHIPLNKQETDLKLAALFAFYYTSIELVYAIEGLEAGKRKLEEQIMNEGISEETIQVAEAYGKQVAQAILKWAKEDGYSAMRSYPRYTPLQEAGKWFPTPPDYSAALEPHWGKLRSFSLDSAQQFRPAPPTNYDLDSNSAFYQEMMEVYTALNNNTSETEAVAKFWDCNPLVKKHQGHVTFAEKKLTPGGHWVNIARMAMKKKNFDLIESTHLYVMLCIGIHDAFISCWEEKYRSNYIRPVTVIQEFIDPKWTPILYTPNFPEYPSGHSVVSASAATILSHYVGTSHAFIDSTETPYGMPARSFSSFYEASNEAAISRLYGGIHFMPAVENGKTQGRQVGNHVLKRIVLKKEL